MEKQELQFIGAVDLWPGLQAGETVRIWAGAPGTGHWDYQLVEERKGAWWGIEVDNTVRELEPCEVE